MASTPTAPDPTTPESSPPESSAQEPIPPLSELDILLRLRAFSRARLFVALLAALVTALIGWGMAAYAFSDVECVPLYAGFKEWDPDYGRVTTYCVEGESPCQCAVEVVPDDPAPDEPPADLEDESLAEHFRARRESFIRYLEDFVRVNETRDIAGLARLVSVIVAGIVSLIVYRGLTDEGYEARLKRAQHIELLEMKRTLKHLLSAVLMMVPTCILAYMTLSAMWLLMADMFEALAMRPNGAILFTALFVGLVGFLVSYLISALSTRHLLTLGMLVFVVGMTAGFAIAGQVLREEGMQFWWQTAISTLGEEPGTDVLFTYVFAGLFIVFLVLWWDVADFLRDALNSSEWPLKWGVFQWLARRLTRRNDQPVSFFAGMRFFYFLAAAGLLSVGIVPLVTYGSRVDYVLTLTLHTGGAAVAALIYWLGGMVFVTIRLSGVVFGWRFITLTVVTFGGILAGVYLLAIDILNLTAMELIGFALCGVWLYAAVDNVLQYSNLKAQHTHTQTAQGRHKPNPVAQKIVERQREMFNQPVLRSGVDAPVSPGEE
ncbi:MAG: hypothetical protein GYB65_16850 [Chloroflexi bacterium]|nr:hypothetical protein [Chloroflexota bacterium]